MVHYLEVTTTALLAMLCPLLVTSQEVFQAEIFLDKNDLNSGLYEGTVRGRRLFTSSAIPHGQGTIYYFNNDKYHRVNYTGEWVDGTRHGKGKTYFRDGSVYTGDYKDGVEEGEGLISYSDGNTLEGEFSDGKIHGHAVFKYPNGDRREGFFFENVLDGQVIYTKADGMIVIELWNNGENIEDQSEVIRPSDDDIHRGQGGGGGPSSPPRSRTTSTPTTTPVPSAPVTIKILKPNVQSNKIAPPSANHFVQFDPSNPSNTAFSDATLEITTTPSSVNHVVDISAIRNAIRSGDRTQVFSSSSNIDDNKKPREPKVQENTMDVRRLRQETDLANREFLLSVFQRVNG